MPLGKRKRDPETGMPFTGYLLFAGDVRPEIVKQFPESSFADHARVIGKLWAALSDADKERYEDVAMRERLSAAHAALTSKDVDPDMPFGDEMENDETPLKRMRRETGFPAPPRAPFSIFASRRRPQLLLRAPGKAYGELSTMSAAQWQLATPRERKLYVDMSETDRIRYNREVEEFVRQQDLDPRRVVTLQKGIQRAKVGIAASQQAAAADWNECCQTMDLQFANDANQRQKQFAQMYSQRLALLTRQYTQSLVEKQLRVDLAAKQQFMLAAQLQDLLLPTMDMLSELQLAQINGLAPQPPALERTPQIIVVDDGDRQFSAVVPPALTYAELKQLLEDQYQKTFQEAFHIDAIKNHRLEDLDPIRISAQLHIYDKIYITSTRHYMPAAAAEQ